MRSSLSCLKHINNNIENIPIRSIQIDTHYTNTILHVVRASALAYPFAPLGIEWTKFQTDMNNNKNPTPEQLDAVTKSTPAFSLYLLTLEPLLFSLFFQFSIVSFSECSTKMFLFIAKRQFIQYKKRCDISKRTSLFLCRWFIIDKNRLQTF